MKKIDTFQAFARGAKSLVAILLVMLMAVGNLFAEEYTVVFSNLFATTTTFSNPNEVNVINDNFSFSMDKQEATNNPAYYGNGTEIRMYDQKNSGLGCAMTIYPATGITITGIEITANAANRAPQIAYVVDGSSDINTLTADNNLTYIISNINASTSFMFYNNNSGSSNVQFRFSEIKITYETSTPEPPTPIVVDVPTFAPEAGTYTAAQSVTIACVTDGATIYYTIDGTTPTANSTLYENAINITETTTINAIAIVGETASNVATATYTINLTPDEPEEPTVLNLDSIATLPYAYNFDDGVDPYFMINNGEATNKWYIGQAQTFDNKKLYISSNNGTTNKYDITKASNVIAYRDVMIPATGAVLSFDYRVNGEGVDDYLEIDLVTDAMTYDIASLRGENEWASFHYDISGEMAGVVRLQFHWRNDGDGQGNQFPAAIDNISIIETPCSQPTALTATVDSTTAVITWQAVEGQTAWTLQYKLADHSEWYTVPATATTVTLTDLQGNSNYEMRVQAVCGENVSAWTNGTFAVACQNGSTTTTVEDVVIGTDATTYNYLPFHGLYNYSYSQQIVNAEEINTTAGNIYSVSFNCYSAPSSTSTGNIKIWMANTTKSVFDSNTDYVDPSTLTLVYEGPQSYAYQTGWNTFTFTTPFEYSGGNLIVAYYEGNDGWNSGSFYAQTTTEHKSIMHYEDDEDAVSYTTPATATGTPVFELYRAHMKLNMDVTVDNCADVIACSNPSNLEVSDITANSVVLTWTAGAEDQTNFIVEYMAEGATEWTSVDVNDTTYTLTELAQLTNYSVKVKANCGSNNWSDVITGSFRTIGICAPVTNLETANVSNTTTLTWTAGGEETAWLVEFKPADASEDAWTSINVSLVPMTTFGGLVGNTDYDVRVKALCDPENTENQSEWTSTSFHSGCAAFDLPFTEEFPTTSMPTCWENQDFHFASSGYAYSYTNGAELISPAINIPAENPTYLTFEVRGAGDYTILASYRGTRADRFAEIYTGTAPTQNTTVVVEIDDLYKGRAVNFKIVNNSTSYQYFYYVKVNQCPFVATALTASNVTGTTLDLAWESDAANFQVQYGEQGFTLGEGTSVDVTGATTVAISELNYETAYDFYVRVVCEGDNGAWTGPVTVTTAPSCSAPTNVNFELSTNMLFWQAGEWGTPVQYNVRYKAEDAEEYTTITVDPVAGVDPFTVISGLNSNTTYEIGVQSVCGVDMESDWTSIEITTPCMAMSLPYTEDFESYTATSSYSTLSGGVMPDCWNNNWTATPSSSSNYCPKITSTTSYNPNGSGKFLFFMASSYSYTYYQNPTMVILPAFDVDLTTAMISFKVRGNNTANVDLNLGYVNDNNEFTALAPVTFGTTAGAASQTVVLSNYTIPTGVKLAFQANVTGTSTASKFFGLDDIKVELIPTCFVPSITVNGTTATITPNANGDAAQSYNLKIGEQTVNVTSTTVNLNTVFTLEAQTDYEVSVQAVCGEGNESEWSENASFTTPCGALDLPYTENFDEYTVDVASGTSAPSAYPNHKGPDCWGMVNLSSTTSTYPQIFLSSSSTYAVSGKCLFFKSSSTTPAYAVLPQFNANIQNLMVEFTYRNEGTNASNGTLYLGYMTDPYDGSTFVPVYECAKTTTKTAVGPVTFSNAGISGTNYYIAFRYTGGSSNNYYAAIDNVSVDVVPTCGVPSISVSGTTATIVPSSIGTAQSYDLQIGEVVANVNDVTVDLTTVFNLDLNTDYEVRVRAICGENDESAWSDWAGFTTPACLGAIVASITGTAATSSYLPTYSYYNYSLTQQIFLSSEMNAPQGGQITSMTFNVSSPVSRNLNIYLAHTNESSFSSFLTLTNPVLVYSGSTLGTTGVNVINFDQPFSYNGTDNLVLMVDDNSGSWSSGLSVAQHSATEMSIRIYSDGTNYDALNPSSYSGTVMNNRNDVTFTLCPPVPDPTCFVPTELSVSEVTDHTAQVSWTDNHDQSSYAVEYRADNENGWTTVNVDTNYYLLSGLLASTDYHVRVKAVCGTDDESGYTDEEEFITVCEHGVEIEFTGTSTSTYIPVYGNYNYSYSQQIFKSSEINAATTISGFEIEVSSTGSLARNIDIYMMHTSENTITSWLPMDNAQLVYSGVVTFTQGWQQINFDTPFDYNGTDNLVLIMDDNTGSYGNYPTFRTHSAGSNIARYYYNDYSNPDPTNPGATAAGTAYAYRNNIRITNCPKATDLAITSINTIADACEVEGTVTINVKNQGYEGTVSTFEAYYQVNEETPVHETVTLSTPIAMNETAEYTFNTLPAFATGTNFINAWVELTGDLVDANNTVTSDPIVALAPATVPYVENFTGLTINHGWNPIDANNDGITMNLNNDINYTFNDELAADDWMMSPCIEMTAGTYTIIYDYKANSSLTESFEVFYGNGAHVADMTNAVATRSFNNTTYETATNTITIAADGVYNFGFHATSLAGNLGFSIDNFKVYPVNDVVVTYAENGTVTPNGVVAVNYGENLTLNIVPDPMYHVGGIEVDGVQVVPEDGTGANFMLYTLENVTEPHTVFVDFKLEFHIFKTVENYRSDLYSDLGGAFVPAATDTTINPDPFTVNMVADPHYHLAGLTISPMVPDMPEDVFAGVVDNGDGTYSYTIDTLVVANYYLNATFRRDTVAINYNVMTGKGYANDSQLLNAGDTYTTWVDYSVNHDVDTTVTFTTDAPYHVADVIVNGVAQGHIDSYTFQDVTEAQNVDIKYGYKIDASVVNYNTYDDIDINVPQGTITPATQYIPEYDAMTVTGTVEEHFHLYQLLVNNVNRIDEVVFDADPHSYSFTMDSIADNYTIIAVVKVDTFAIVYNVLAGQGYADASGLLVEGDSYSTIVNYGDNWYSNIEPATGYSIENVTLDGQNLYTANNYQFNYIEESHAFDVTFVANTYTVTTNAYGNGTVSDGISFTYDPENAVDYEFTATAAEGYHIVSVVINNEEMDITDPANFTYTIENVADNYVINAHFAINTYTMTAEAYNYGGTITPSGTQIVNYGAEVVYTINANEGYYIAETSIDGVTTSYTQDDAMNTLDVPFTNINDNHEVVVAFLPYMYTITTAVDGGNGYINELYDSLTETVQYGTNLMLTFDAEDNYQVADVVVDGVSMGAITSYEFININANHTVNVTFEAIMYTLTATSNTEGCTITPATTTVQAGSNVAYTLTVANGYHLVNVVANGEEVVVANNAFTISDVQSDYTIFANFAPNYVTVTVDQPAHATITPGTMTYAYGATPSYMIVPEVGYDVVSVTAGDAIVNVTYNNGIGTFTLDALTQDITLTATTSIKKFEITVTQGANGTIAPGTQTNVEYGSNKTFTITPNDYYVVADVIVDGSSRGALSSYTFYNVTGNHTITAVFEANCQTPTNLTAFDIDTTSAVINWMGTAPSYEVRYKAADAASYTTQTATTTSLQLTGLTPNTLYEYGVRAVCGANMTSDWATNAFTTRAVPVDPTVGIANADMSSIKVYSFQNNVYIVNEDGIAISNVDIYDIYGKQVYTGKVLSSPEVISLSVANGNYVVRLATENGVGVYKVAIVR